MSEEFKLLKEAGKRWASKLIPERWAEEFREMSPGKSNVHVQPNWTSV